MIVLLVLLLQFRLPVTEYELKNDLRILVYEDHSVPVVSVQVWFRTGSYNDPRGLSGMSHFLEHMSFKGTEEHGPKEYDLIIERNGGEENAFTSHHYIAYYANLHKDRYTIALELESDRMVNLLLDSLELERERGVVLEELRLGENNPFEYLWDQVRANGFQHSPYQISIVGWQDDVERITRQDMADYYHKYFNPANAIVVIAGDVRPKKAKEYVEKYFGAFKGNKVAQTYFPEPKQVGERRFVIERDLDYPILMLGYHTPAIGDYDYYPVELLLSILGKGKLSRLYQVLVYEKRLATQVGIYIDDNLYPGLSNIYAYPAPDVTLDSLEKGIYQVIEDVKDSIDRKELNRVQNQVLSEFTYAQDGAFRIGLNIGWSEVVAGSYHFLEEYPLQIGKVTIEEIKKAAELYLKPENRVVGVIR